MADWMLTCNSQLKPTNTTSKGKLVFGQFTEQLDISLPTRLLNNGFPYVYLKEQQRMVSGSPSCGISATY